MLADEGDFKAALDFDRGEAGGKRGHTRTDAFSENFRSRGSRENASVLSRTRFDHEFATLKA